MPAPKGLHNLIERFHRNHKQYTSQDYKEAELRVEFLDPLFEMLGWDVANRKGYDEYHKEVVYEPSLEVEGGTKTPDYAFRLGGVTEFFVEAKKPAIDIGHNTLPAFQLKRYAWSAKLPLSILTNFEDIAVYDCRYKPDKRDSPTKARIMRSIYYRDLEERWDELEELISPEAIQKGSFDEFLEDRRRARGTSEVDSEFLKEIETWREMLAKNMALRNPELDIGEMNFCVQRLIDRMIFLRICEDRGTEPLGQLQDIAKKDDMYRQLLNLFYRADAKYNSGMFHFQPDKKRVTYPDELASKLKVDDKALKDIIKNLYYPDSPFQFDVIPADILGQVYEQFLGKVIRLTKGHRAKVEEKPDVKKAGGVYYTPTYIVECIVEETVGKLCKEKAPNEMEKLRVLDPACGSGSFLIASYEHLLKEHLDWYVRNSPKKRQDCVFHGPRGEWRLTLREKKRILLNSIFGVDIDSQAVEVTKLNLLLKALEGENKESVDNVVKWFREPALPDLGNNIKCGNSLIDIGIMDSLAGLPTDNREKEMARIKPFNWEEEFPEIMEVGGFDAVIGNPPWGASFSEIELDYLRDVHQEIIVRMIDSYMYFIHQSSKILLGPDGRFGMIIPSTFLTQKDAERLRRFLIDHFGLEIVINLGQRVFGPKVLNTSTILVFSDDDSVKSQERIVVGDLRHYRPNEKPTKLGEVDAVASKAWLDLVQSDSYASFFTLNLPGVALLQRLSESFPTFKEMIDGKIQRGVTSDYTDAHVVGSALAKSSKIEKEILRPVVLGKDITRYGRIDSSTSILYLTRDDNITKYPNARTHLENYRDKIKCKEVKEGKHPWFSLHRPRNPDIFNSPKFIGLTTTKDICVALDESADYYATDSLYLFRLNPELDIHERFVIGVLHSTCFQFLYQTNTQGEQRVIPQIKATKLYGLPFPLPDLSNPVDKASHDKIVTLVESMQKLTKSIQEARTPDAKTHTQRMIRATEKEIDVLVYELYGLTEDEIKIVEESRQKNASSGETS